MESTLRRSALVAAQTPEAKTTPKAPQEAVASSLGEETTATAFRCGASSRGATEVGERLRHLRQAQLRVDLEGVLARLCPEAHFKMYGLRCLWRHPYR